MNRIVQVLKLLRSGSKQFWHDVKSYVRVYPKIRRKQFEQLTASDITLYQLMRSDIVRVSPLVVISFLPLTNFVIVPLMFLIPTKLLSSQFWSESQKRQFYANRHFLKREHCTKIREIVLATAGEFANDSIAFQQTLHAAFENGPYQPSQINWLRLRELFAKPSLQLQRINTDHFNLLMKIHGFWPLNKLNAIARLTRHAELLRETDRALDRNRANLHLESDDFLRVLCHMRGFRVAGLPSNQLVANLQNWLDFSRLCSDYNSPETIAATTACHSNNYHSMLLHGPIFFNA